MDREYRDYHRVSGCFGLSWRHVVLTFDCRVFEILDLVTVRTRSKFSLWTTGRNMVYLISGSRCRINCGLWRFISSSENVSLPWYSPLRCNDSLTTVYTNSLLATSVTYWNPQDPILIFLDYYRLNSRSKRAETDDNIMADTISFSTMPAQTTGISLHLESHSTRTGDTHDALSRPSIQSTGMCTQSTHLCLSWYSRLLVDRSSIRKGAW